MSEGRKQSDKEQAPMPTVGNICVDVLDTDGRIWLTQSVADGEVEHPDGGPKVKFTVVTDMGGGIHIWMYQQDNPDKFDRQYVVPLEPMLKAVFDGHFRGWPVIDFSVNIATVRGES